MLTKTTSERRWRWRWGCWCLGPSLTLVHEFYSLILGKQRVGGRRRVGQDTGAPKLDSQFVSASTWNLQHKRSPEPEQWHGLNGALIQMGQQLGIKWQAARQRTDQDGHNDGQDELADEAGASKYIIHLHASQPAGPAARQWQNFNWRQSANIVWRPLGAAVAPLYPEQGDKSATISDATVLRATACKLVWPL